MTRMTTVEGRRLLHTRNIHCEAYERPDGLIDLEAVLQDTKTHPITLLDGRVVPPQAPVHRMALRITVDRERWIKAVEAYSEAFPYSDCEQVESIYQQMVGLRIEPGFTREVKQLFRGTAGCTHISDLIPILATVIFQTLWGQSDIAKGRRPSGEAAKSSGPSPLGGCYGLRLDGQVVHTYFPERATKAMSDPKGQQGSQSQPELSSPTASASAFSSVTSASLSPPVEH